MNEEFLVNASHQLGLITSLPLHIDMKNHLLDIISFLVKKTIGNFVSAIKKSLIIQYSVFAKNTHNIKSTLHCDQTTRMYDLLYTGDL